MRRVAPLVLFIVLLASCGGGSDVSAPPVVRTATDASTTTIAADPGEPGDPTPREIVELDPRCEDYATWLMAVGPGAPAGDPLEQVRTLAGDLGGDEGPAIVAALDGGDADYALAAELDLVTIARCGIALTEAAHLAAVTGRPDCLLDAERQVIFESLCDDGGRPRTTASTTLSDGAFCSTAQAFVRDDAASLNGDDAIDALNAFVDAAPTGVERPLRDIVSAVGADDVEELLRELYQLDRVVVSGCGEGVAAEYLALVRAAIAAVTPAPPTTAPPLPEDLPPEQSGPAPYAALCEAIEARFVGSAPSEWGKVLAIAIESDAPAGLIGVLNRLADPNVQDQAVRESLVAQLQPFMNGPCVTSGLDNGGSGAGPADGPPPTTTVELI